jgi:polar amino acid transport system substrate-binding protein
MRLDLRLAWCVFALLALCTPPVSPACACAPSSRAQASLDDVRARGVLRYAIDPAGGAPFAMPEPDDPDTLTGFEVELMAAIGRALDLRVEPVAGDWLALVDLMKSGRADLAINGFEVTEERAAEVDFSAPYYVYDQQPTIRAADRARFADFAALRGDEGDGRAFAPVATLNGAASVDVLVEFGWPREAIREYDDGLAPYAELKAGRVDLVVQDGVVAQYYAGSDPELLNLPPLGKTGFYAALFRKGDDALRAEFDRALAGLKASGELAALYRRWKIWTPEQASIGIVGIDGIGGDVGSGGGSATEAAGEPGADEATANVDGAAAARAFAWPAVLWALAKACVNTVVLTALAMPLAVALGVLLALAMRSQARRIAWPARTYVAVVRGTPLLVQLYLVYYSLPAFGLWLAGEVPSLASILDVQAALTWPAFLVAIVVLGGNYGAYEAEVQRAGLDSVPEGQRRAALALGFPRRASLWRIELPQGFRTMMPATINDLNSMIKDSSLVSLIAVPELMQVALGIGKATLMVPAVLVAAAAYYLLLSLAADWLARRLVASADRGSGIVGGRRLLAGGAR